MNSHGLHDDIIRAWVNGVMAFEKQDIMFRTVDSLKIEQILMNVYHGRIAVSPYDQHLYFDNVVIAREYIGPIPGTVPILQEEKHVLLPFLLNLLLAPDPE